jgi:hypothetical protein
MALKIPLVFEVCEKRCDECLFSKNRIVSKARMSDLLLEACRNDSYFQCHKGTLVGRKICCRGFYTRYERDVLIIRLAKLLKIVKFVPVPGGGRPEGN